MNDIIGYYPIVIGGWAVWLYNPGLGSRDIDVVLPSWEARDRVIPKYLANNGYEVRSTTFGTAEWVKYLIPGDESSETYLDVCTLQDMNPIHGKDGEVPWKIAQKWQREKKIGTSSVYVPDPEPLLVLKAKAAWDRNHDLTKVGGNDFLQDKVRKDRYDILSLLQSCTFDENILTNIFSDYEFGACFTDALERAVIDKDVQAQHYLDKERSKVMKERVIVLLDRCGLG